MIYTSYSQSTTVVIVTVVVTVVVVVLSIVLPLTEVRFLTRTSTSHMSSLLLPLTLVTEVCKKKV